jgi:hypothetical protein
MELTNEKIEQANKRGQLVRDFFTDIVSVAFDKVNKRVVIKFKSGFECSFVPKDLRGFEKATDDQLSVIEIASPLSIFFPKIDEGIYIPSLFESFFGHKPWVDQAVVVAA